MVNEYRLYGKSDLAVIRSSCEERFNSWSDDWLATPGQASIELLNESFDMEIFAEEDKLAFYRGDKEQWCIVRGIDSIKKDWASLLFHVANDFIPRNHIEKSSLGPDVAIKAVEDLAIRMTSGSNVLETQMTKEELIPLVKQSLIPGRQAAIARFDFKDLTIEIILSADLLLNLFHSISKDHKDTGRKHDLALFTNSLGNQSITGKVYVGRAELTLHDMSTLQVGDVIRLDNAVSMPPKFVVDCENLSFSGYLGKLTDSKAFKFHKLNELVD